MAPVNNSSVIFNSIPESYPVLNETLVYGTSTIDLDTVPLNGGILIKSHYFSIDPYQRGRMRAPDPEAQIPPFQLGEPMWGFVIASVLRSEKENVCSGDILYVDECPFQEYNVIAPDHGFRVIKNESGVPLSAYIGILGMPGQTAFYGLEVVGLPLKGETIYVSSGASTVGSLVVQLAKLKGLRVIASAGSKDKVAFLQSIGADVAFNYKTESVSDVLVKEGPIDIYWDNVGGSSLEAALDALRWGGRAVICGAVGEYNAQERYGVKNTAQILYKQLRLEGAVVFVTEKIYEGQLGNPVKFLDALVPLVKSGQIKFTEQVFDGIGNVGEAVIAVQKGTSTAKVVVKVAAL